MNIEEITEKDFAEVGKLIKEEFPYTEAFGQKITERLKRKDVFVFVAHEKELEGFVDVSLFEGRGVINGFCVKKGFREKGLGQQLLSFGVKFLKERGAQKIRLLVKKENFVAKKMYEKEGFKFISIHPKQINGSVIEIWELTENKNLSEKFVS